jgi:hypothetical protein
VSKLLTLHLRTRCQKIPWPTPLTRFHLIADLAGEFVVWAVSPEARFLRNKYLWVNWDVDELKSRRQELERPHQLNIRMSGLPIY